MAKVITLRFAGRCADPSCRADLKSGDRALWYPGGRVYGLDCHERQPRAPRPTPRHRARYDGPGWDGEPLGQTLSRYDRGGVYNGAGELIGRVACGHEDYPCCGC